MVSIFPQEERLPFVEASRARGRVYLYYRRGGTRLPLPGPEGSNAFLSEYHRLRRQFECATVRHGEHTVAAAIAHYLSGADYLQLADSSRYEYRRVLAEFSERVGHLELIALDDAWVSKLRDKYAQGERHHQWLAIRARMVGVEKAYRRAYPKLGVGRAWADSDNLKVADSDQNRPWPDRFLIAALRAATPEFRAWLTVALLTSQRNSDVCAFSHDAYDRELRTLSFEQIKTKKPLILHVPDIIADTFDSMSGRLPGHLLVTPRGVAWETKNVRETMQSLCHRLGMGRYVVHGLRATGPTALKMLGFENRAIRALTGHASDAQLERYLRGVAEHDLAKGAQEAMSTRFSKALEKALEGANMHSFSGSTGKGAAKKGIFGSSVKGRSALAPTAKQLPNAKHDAQKG